MFRFPWFDEAPGKLAGIALAEELVENIANFLFTAALPFFTFLCRPKQQRFWIFDRFPQESWVKTYASKPIMWVFGTSLMAFPEPERPEGRWRQQTSVEIVIFHILLIITFMSADDGRQISGWTECVLLKSSRSHKCSKAAPWVPRLLLLDCNQTLLHLKPLCRVLIRLIITDAHGVPVAKRSISGSLLRKAKRDVA